MLSFLKTLLAKDEEPANGNRQIQLAASSLLIAMTKADSEVSESERGAVRKALSALLGIEGTELDQILEEARAEVDASVSLYDFTKILQRQQTPEENLRLVELLWSVAIADGEIDPEEELLVRKVAGLLYVQQTDFIAAKRRALTGARPGV